MPRLILDMKNHPGRIFSPNFIDRLPDLSSSTNSSGETLEQEYGFDIALVSVVKQSVGFISNLLCGIFLVKWVTYATHKSNLTHPLTLAAYLLQSVPFRLPPFLSLCEIILVAQHSYCQSLDTLTPV